MTNRSITTVSWTRHTTEQTVEWLTDGKVQYSNPRPSYLQAYGYSTPEEQVAYQDGYYQAEQVMTKWIENWEGNTNSGLGKILHKKFEELKEKL